MRKRIEIDVEALIREYAEGKTTDELAQEIGVSRSVVRDRLHSANVVMRPSGPQMGRRGASASETRCLYESGMSIQEIADKTGSWPSGVRYKLKRAGTTMRPRGGRPGRDSRLKRPKQKRKSRFTPVEFALPKTGIGRYLSSAWA